MSDTNTVDAGWGRRVELIPIEQAVAVYRAALAERERERAAYRAASDRLTHATVAVENARKAIVRATGGQPSDQDVMEAMLAKAVGDRVPGAEVEA